MKKDENRIEITKKKTIRKDIYERDSFFQFLLLFYAHDCSMAHWVVLTQIFFNSDSWKFRIFQLLGKSSEFHKMEKKNEFFLVSFEGLVKKMEIKM